MTYCEVDRRCAGTLVLEDTVEGNSDLHTVQVPLGASIRRQCRSILLHQLVGERAVVTESLEAGAAVARAIELVAPEAPVC
ncbi:MAG: hypothetical protein ACT4P4_00625 [Betaproteobacteria bacterium]